ncbi:hypothetical protein M569_11163 [Genlisea aurea]|uniref:Uncharacterized protein n=1 Tax=Genlisea aurea TaxID=192259 RepID=S8DL89_9LAMI|nr:hypothetical protein M569_11163 [Genlisea aurea]
MGKLQQLAVVSSVAVYFLFLIPIVDSSADSQATQCAKEVAKSGENGFSSACPYDVAVPTMVRGMDLAIALAGLRGPKLSSIGLDWIRGGALTMTKQLRSAGMAVYFLLLAIPIVDSSNDSPHQAMNDSPHR